MKTATAIIMFFLLLIPFGAFCNALFGVALQGYQESMANQTVVNPNPFPELTTIFGYLVAAFPVLGIVCIAFWLTGDEETTGGGYLGR